MYDQRHLRRALIFITTCLHAYLHVSIVESQLLGTSESKYVIELHTSMKDVHLETMKTSQRQIMMTRDGLEFECYLPTISDTKENIEEVETQVITKTENEILAFSQSAVRNIGRHCLQILNPEDNEWNYEVCPSDIIYKVRNLNEKDEEQVDESDNMEEGSSLDDGRDESADKEMENVKDQEDNDIELATFVSDTTKPRISYDYFPNEVLKKLPHIVQQRQPIYTEIYKSTLVPNETDDESAEEILVQYMCSNTAREGQIAGISYHQIKSEGKTSKKVAGFLILSSSFCDSAILDGIQDTSLKVSTYLDPLRDSSTCIKRKEGWWAYEFCFGKGILQFHRDLDGSIAVEYSMGTYNAQVNANFAASEETLVLESLEEATHGHSVRPAYKEIFTHGTVCATGHARSTTVLYFCTPDVFYPQIHSIKETQTCKYTIKILTHLVCDHPYFIKHEKTITKQPDIIHCHPTPVPAVL